MIRLLLILISIILIGFDVYAEQKSVTIYVHGTQQFGSKLLPKDIWFCQQGLHHINELPNSSMYFKDAELICKADPKKFIMKHYYTFGWSGNLSVSARQKAGEELYHDICNLLRTYKHLYHEYPSLRVITFSHGGNVALHMVQNLPFFKQQPIDLELILIACPVQKTTEKYINSLEISRSYVIYSTKDLLQVADYYKYEGKKYFSGRTFITNHPRCYQILAKVNGKPLCHTELYHSYMRHLPATLTGVHENCLDEYNHMNFNVNDSKFIFYTGLNFISVLLSNRK